MELPEYRAAAQRLEAVQEQVIAAEQEIAALEKQRKALQGNVKLLKAVEKVKPDLDAIQPEKTLTGAVKGVTQKNFLLYKNLLSRSLIELVLDELHRYELLNHCSSCNKCFHNFHPLTF